MLVALGNPRALKHHNTRRWPEELILGPSLSFDPGPLENAKNLILTEVEKRL